MDRNDPPLLDVVDRLDTSDVTWPVIEPPTMAWSVTGTEEPEVRLVPARDRRRNPDSR